jgi:hypothetical protein
LTWLLQLPMGTAYYPSSRTRRADPERAQTPAERRGPRCSGALESTLCD